MAIRHDFELVAADARRVGVIDGFLWGVLVAGFLGLVAAWLIGGSETLAGLACAVAPMASTRRPRRRTRKARKGKRMKHIYETRRLAGRTFVLAERIDSYPEAQKAAAEYRCEGLYCRVEPVEEEMYYYLWTAPGRKRMPKLLPDEFVFRVSVARLTPVHIRKEE